MSGLARGVQLDLGMTTRDPCAPHPVGFLLAWPPPRPGGIEQLRQAAMAAILAALGPDHDIDRACEWLGMAPRTLRRWLATTPELATGRPHSAAGGR